jgi:hypothetical protein
MRGVLFGVAATVPLPFLDLWLDGNGEALADTGEPIPSRFGTWFWGCGYTPGRFVPTRIGSGFDLPSQLRPLERHAAKLNIFSGFDSKLDGSANTPHFTGNIALRTGASAASQSDVVLPTFDTLIADKVSHGTRFHSLEMSATGNSRDSYSFAAGGVLNPSAASPTEVYQRVFGLGFQDPNSAEFKPDPALMTRLSVLSAVKDQRDALSRRVGAADRARLDEYYTSLRQTEKQLALELEKPLPADACIVPQAPPQTRIGYDLDQVHINHRLMSQLLAMALACNQTRVFNMVFSGSTSGLRRAGTTTTHHEYTHQEQNDAKLGYQVESNFYADECMAAFAEFLDTLANVKEGSATLLDNMLVFAHSDCSFARYHSCQSMAMMTAGNAGGRVRTGLHIAGQGDPVTRVGLTLQQVMGVGTDEFGTKSQRTRNPVSEIVA